MNNEINYEIDNCITDLDTLKILDKRAMKDLKNNTHEIEQQEVLTIIREFIRLRNDYNKEKEKNKELEDTLKCTQNSWYEDTKKIEELINKTNPDKIKIMADSFNEKVLDKFNQWFISKDKIKEKIEELEKEKMYFNENDFIAETVKRLEQIEVLQELIEQ